MEKIRSVIVNVVVVLVIQSASLLVGASHNDMKRPQGSGYVITKDFTFTGHEREKAIIMSPMKAGDAQPIQWASASLTRRISDRIDSWNETFDAYDSLYMGLMGSILFWAMLYYFQQTQPAFVPAIVPAHPIVVPPVPLLSSAEIERIYMDFAAKHAACGA